MDTIFTPKNAKKYNCKKCDFKCYKKCDYDRHLGTAKHKRIHLDTIFTPKNAENMYVCEKCNKQYKFNSGLWKHKQKCNNNIKYKKNIKKIMKMILIFIQCLWQ